GRIQSQPPAPIRAFARADHRREADASIGAPAQRGRGPEKDEAPVVGIDGDHRVLERTDVKRLHERPVHSGIAASIEPADAIAKARCRRDIDDPSLGRNGEPANLRRRAEVGPAGAIVARHQHVTVPGEQERSGGPVRGGWRRRQADHAANDGGRTASAMRSVGSAAIATGNPNTDARLSSGSAVAAESFSAAKIAAIPRYTAQPIATGLLPRIAIGNAKMPARTTYGVK